MTPVSTPEEVAEVNNIINELRPEWDECNKSFPMVAQVCQGDVSRALRTLPFLVFRRTEALTDRLAQLPFVRALVQRAVKEAEIYVRNGITHLEVENVGAPYFVGQGQCPIEELLLEHVILRELRKAHPTIALGMHVLSSNELEALPIAICHGVAFIRSESTVFTGIRPEGQTTNNGNLARFMYVRNTLRAFLGHPVTTPVFPQIWSDLQKKHTVFLKELEDLTVWLGNITFMKLEGLIITGLETGSDVKEVTLQQTREAVDKIKQWNHKTFPAKDATTGVEHYFPEIPIITGSGLDLEMYCKYADYMIIGTALKEAGYWENPVSEDNVKSVVKRVAAAQRKK